MIKKLIIVSPCYNEEETLLNSGRLLKTIIEELISEKLISEDSNLLLVDDGSTDRTWQLIESLYSEDSKKYKAIRLSKNKGHQVALYAGMIAAYDTGADYVITIDIDLQDNTNLIKTMVEKANSVFNIIYSIKSNQIDSFLKRNTSNIFYKLLNFIGVDNIPNHADFRLVDKKILEQLSITRENNLYLRGLIKEFGFNYTTVENEVKERKYGYSKYTIEKMFQLAQSGIISYSKKPLYFSIYVGFIGLIFSFLFFLYIVFIFFEGSRVAGWASILGAIIFFSSLITINLGIIALYIGKIYDETKQRPRYIIKAKLN